VEDDPEYASSLRKTVRLALLVVTICHCRLYPVDKSRVNEFGESYEEQPKRKSHAD
jgi:hypothetical protein